MLVLLGPARQICAYALESRLTSCEADLLRFEYAASNL